MSSPCPGIDYKPKSIIDEPYPGSSDAKQNRTPQESYPSQPNTPPPVRGYYPEFEGPKSEYAGGLGDQRQFDADIYNAAVARKLAQETAGGNYYAPPTKVDPRTVPPQPIEDMTAREFLHFYSRNPQVSSSKRKTFASLITASDANYQAFIDLVAFHLLNGDTDFMTAVMESGANEINEARQEQLRAVFNLFNEVGR